MTNKICLFILVFLLFKISIQAQKKAVTENGDEVILYDDGTWKYSTTPLQNDSNLIKENPIKFKKTTNESFLLKSKKNDLGFWIDPKKWSFEKPIDTPDAEFQLTLKGQSLVAYIITEEGEIPLESFKTIALINGRKESPDLHIMNQEYRIVNGLRVLYLQMEGSVQGIKFTFLGYYYSSTTSVVQYLVTLYSSTKDKHFKEAEELLNGLVDLKLSGSEEPEKDTTRKYQPDSLTQGSLSTNNNCKLFFEGQWNYKVQNDQIDVVRTFNKTTEYTEHKKYFFEYDTKWIDNCDYDLIFRRTNKPNFKLINPGEVMHIEVLTIDKNTMRYKATFRNNDVYGEMNKAN